MILKGFTFDIQVTLAVFAVQHMQTYATLGENVLPISGEGKRMRGKCEGDMSGRDTSRGKCPVPRLSGQSDTARLGIFYCALV